jgi:hypothetical protein
VKNVSDWGLIRRFAAHPGEAALLAGAISGDARTARHLAACPACAARLVAAEAAWAAARDEVVAEADAAFSEGRLARQHASVMRRLDPAAHPGRVLAFPGPVHVPRPRRAVATRWVAAAAVAGLLLGVSAGRVLEWRRHTAPAPTGTAAFTSAAARTAPVQDAVREEAFLAAVTTGPLTPSFEPLRALDAMTPAEGTSPDR